MVTYRPTVVMGFILHPVQEHWPSVVASNLLMFEECTSW